MEDWIAEAVGRMHVNKITGRDVAKKLGVSATWVSYLLNGKRSQNDAETRIKQAIDEILKERTK